MCWCTNSAQPLGKFQYNKLFFQNLKFWGIIQDTAAIWPASTRVYNPPPPNTQSSIAIFRRKPRNWRLSQQDDLQRARFSFHQEIKTRKWWAFSTRTERSESTYTFGISLHCTSGDNDTQSQSSSLLHSRLHPPHMDQRHTGFSLQIMLKIFVSLLTDSSTTKMTHIHITWRHFLKLTCHHPCKPATTCNSCCHKDNRWIQEWIELVPLASYPTCHV